MVEIDTGTENECYLISVKGEVDASSSIELDNALEKALNESKKILIDLSQLEYISSAGLGVFISYLEELKGKKISLVLFGLKPKVREVFNILGLQHLIKIVGTKAEGLDAV